MTMAKTDGAAGKEDHYSRIPKVLVCKRADSLVSQGDVNKSSADHY